MLYIKIEISTRVNRVLINEFFILGGNNSKWKKENLKQNQKDY